MLIRTTAPFLTAPRAAAGTDAPAPCDLEEACRREAQRSPNPVLRSLLPVIDRSRHVGTDVARLREVARTLKDQPMEPSNWRMPIFLEEDSPRTIQFFMLGNALNFRFWGKDSTDRFSTEYGGTRWDGAMAMWACLKRAVEQGVPILDASYLAGLTPEQAGKIFPGIPMLEERTAILNEVGKNLQERYDGHFQNLYTASGGRAFNGGNGFVERLIRDFPSFEDREGSARFDKRAQLSVAMLASRLKGTGLFDVSDLGQLTVFADYQLPKTLHHLGVLTYSPELEQKIQRGQMLPKGSREEVELRAHTIYAAKLLELAFRREGKSTDAMGVDYLLWAQGRSLKGVPHHLTATTAY
jgi:hypothetical protein